jgi:hypothetical protein
MLLSLLALQLTITMLLYFKGHSLYFQGTE